jgi:hypothetical protein
MRSLGRLLETEAGLAMRFYTKLAQKLAESLLSTNPSDNKKAPKLEEPTGSATFETVSAFDKILETKFGLKDEFVIKGRACKILLITHKYTNVQ